MGKIIQITCKNCGRKLSVQAPPRSGVFKATCPNCKTALKFSYKMEQLNPGGQLKSNPAIKPNANQKLHAPTQIFAGNKMPKTPLQPLQSTQLDSIAQIIDNFGNVVGKLKFGENTIGRVDVTQPSDIMIPNDDTISRRSIAIDVEKNGLTYCYTLKVMKATNMVFVKNTPVTIGNKIRLNIGDSIRLGMTMLYLKN
jgi:phage FluMu protein Com